MQKSRSCWESFNLNVSTLATPIYFTYGIVSNTLNSGEALKYNNFFNCITQLLFFCCFSDCFSFPEGFSIQAVCGWAGWEVQRSYSTDADHKWRGDMLYLYPICNSVHVHNSMFSGATLHTQCLHGFISILHTESLVNTHGLCVCVLTAFSYLTPPAPFCFFPRCRFEDDLRVPWSCKIRKRITKSQMWVILFWSTGACAAIGNPQKTDRGLFQHCRRCTESAFLSMCFLLPDTQFFFL